MRYSLALVALFTVAPVGCGSEDEAGSAGSAGAAGAGAAGAAGNGGGAGAGGVGAAGAAGSSGGAAGTAGSSGAGNAAGANAGAGGAGGSGGASSCPTGVPGAGASCAGVKVQPGQAGPCAFLLPTPPSGSSLDFNLVNVSIDDSSGGSTALGNVCLADDCSTHQNGWHYDANLAPSSVILCPDVCALLDANAKVGLLLGCSTNLAPPI